MHTVLRRVMLVVALVAFVAALTACAKYPVVSGARASSPSAAAPAPIR